MFHPHHLELFYFVARFGGISAACRQIAYGIGQPAVSGQMADFERQVGARLFQRRPFQLTAQGRLIYDHIRPCFDHLDALWKQVREQPAQIMRIAAADSVGPELLRAIIDAAAPWPAGVRLELLTGTAAELPTWVILGRHG